MHARLHVAGKNLDFTTSIRRPRSPKRGGLKPHFHEDTRWRTGGRGIPRIPFPIGETRDLQIIFTRDVALSAHFRVASWIVVVATYRGRGGVA